MSERRGDVGTIRQQIGEILGTVRSLNAQVREQRDDSRRQEERLDRDISTIKDEQYRTNANIQQRLETISALVREVDDKARSLTGEITGIKGEVTGVKASVTKLEGPVQQFTELRSKAFGYYAALAAVLGAIYMVIAPYISKLLGLTK